MSWWQTILPAYTGFTFPTNMMEQFIVAGTGLSAVFVQYIGNLSIQSLAVEQGENIYDARQLCLDQIGELMYGVFSVAQIAVHLSTFPG